MMIIMIRVIIIVIVTIAMIMMIVMIMLCPGFRSELEDVQAVLMMTDIHNLMGADSTECMMERKYVRPLVMGGLTMQSFVFPAVKGIAYCQDSEAGYRDKDLPSE